MNARTYSLALVTLGLGCFVLITLVPVAPYAAAFWGAVGVALLVSAFGAQRGSGGGFSR